MGAQISAQDSILGRLLAKCAAGTPLPSGRLSPASTATIDSSVPIENFHTLAAIVQLSRSNSLLEVRCEDRPKFRAKCKSELKQTILLQKLLENIDQLPDSYEHRITQQGQSYFEHVHTGLTTWHDPRVPRHLELPDDVLGQLPAQWEVRKTVTGRAYFVNHQLKTTQFTDPRFSCNKESIKDAVLALVNERRETDKISSNQRIEIFLEDLQSLLLRKTHQYVVDVDRSNLVLTSFRRIMWTKCRQFRKRLVVRFFQEPGIDYGGLGREWITELSAALLSPQGVLFTAAPSGSIEVSLACAHAAHSLDYFEFVGRLCGIALLHQLTMSHSLCLPLLKLLLCQRVLLDDLSDVDPTLHRSLAWILHNDIGDTLADTHFVAASFDRSATADGTPDEFELVPNGHDQLLSEDNKHDYVRLYVQWRLYGYADKPINALRKGFWDVVPLHSLAVLSAKDLQLLLFGADELSVIDWRQHSVLKNFNEASASDQRLACWFWQAVHEFDDVTKRQLLYFVTGCSRLPPQGFQALRGSSTSNDAKPFTLNLVKHDAPTSLPRAHTCFNKLDLPPYKSYEQLRDKLRLAVLETRGFNIE